MTGDVSYPGRIYYNSRYGPSTGETTWYSTNSSSDAWRAIDLARVNGKELENQVLEGWDPDKNEYGG